jgi:hypothetical protein
MSLAKIAELVLTPGVLLFVFYMLNKRIDDLKSEMKSDHANLAKLVGGIDVRLRELNDHFIKHLEFHVQDRSIDQVKDQASKSD